MNIFRFKPQIYKNNGNAEHEEKLPIFLQGVSSFVISGCFIYSSFNHIWYCLFSYFIYSSVIHLFICYLSIHLLLLQKTFHCNDHTIQSLELLTAKTPLLHMLYYMTWLTHDFWTRTGGWEFDRSHGAGTSSPSH